LIIQDYFTKLKTTYIFCTSILEEIENQKSSQSLLSQTIKVSYENALKFKEEISKKMSVQGPKYEEILKKFPESLENLKKIKLHPVFNNIFENAKTLKDIYLPENEMNKFKEYSYRNKSSLI